MPKSGPSVIVCASSFDHPQARLADFVTGHPFNHKLELLLPRSEEGRGQPLQIRDCELHHFGSIRCKLSAFLEPEFLEAAIADRGRSFQALTVSSELDRTAAAAITPDGVLNLRVDTESYRRIGLVGKCSTLESGVYCITVDLCSTKFRSNQSHRARVMECLSERTQPVECVFSANGDLHSLARLLKPTLEPVRILHSECCASSKATKFPCLQRLVRIPDPTLAAEMTRTSQLHSALECLGKLAVGGKVDGECGFEVEDGVLELKTWTGFILPDQVLARVVAARELIEAGRCPWAALLVWGFQDAPVSWNGAENSRPKREGGENDYALLLLPDQQYIAFLLTGSGTLYRSAAPNGGDRTSEKPDSPYSGNLEVF